jgi:hypothetical protein
MSRVEGHWHSLFEGFSTSSLDFYELVKAGIASRQIPDLKIKSVKWRQGGLGSGKRVYLRVSREGMNFDICAAPFGTGFFFSWWLARVPRILLDLLFLFFLIIFFDVESALVGKAMGLNFEGQNMSQILNQGCSAIFLITFVFFGVLFGLGLLARYGNVGLEPTVLSMPITGFFYGLIFRPVTYFNEDTALMFRESVHNAVLEAIDQVTTAQGVRGLSEEARKITFEPRGRRS